MGMGSLCVFQGVMDSEENAVESSSDAGPSGLEEPSESGMGMETSEASRRGHGSTALSPTPTWGRAQRGLWS
ncbi:hypothetical protein ANANG_G00253980 [Anguilla anguilla]|uniref:Uncharacterized protein n=1 Tax=Anguilla anguilla TaxID=7936 RepID=A0A9D3LTX2_ANGAN|nr:hypothetical protein ANANG_G00253980 [Anguilla anguilla]